MTLIKRNNYDMSEEINKTQDYPFKFLQEYLDDVCEIAFCKHWNEITN